MAILIISSRCLVKLVTARPVSAVRHARPLYSSGDLRLSVVWRSADLSLSVSACYIARGFQRQGMQQCRGLVEGRGCGLLSEGEGGGGFRTITSLTCHCGRGCCFWGASSGILRKNYTESKRLAESTEMTGQQCGFSFEW